MSQMLFIGVGGFFGTLARYGVGLATRHFAHPVLGTLAVNSVGCLLIGLLIFGGHKGVAPQWRLPLEVGFLGAFTTFSTFGFQSVALFQQGTWGLALLNVVANLVGGALALFIAFRLCA